MNGKQQYYGDLKKRSNQEQDETLKKLYRESETNDDVEDFLKNNDDIDEETPKEKKSAKKTATIVWIAIISIFSLPISLPIALCLLIIVFVLFITLLILFISLVGAGLIVITAGAGVFLSGIIAPGIGQKLVCFGGGMLVTAIGMALCFLTVIVYILLIRLAVQIIKKSAEKKVKKA